MAITTYEKPSFDDFPLQSKHSLDYIVAADSRSVEVSLPIEVIIGKTRRPRLVAIAGVHGNEIDGMTALQDFWQEINATEMKGTLIVVPAANPPAVWASTRHGPDDNLDMNRIFPGNADGSLTEKIAFRLFHDVVLGADLLATFHGWTNNGMVIPYTEFADGIGQANIETESYRASVAFGFGVHRISPYKEGRLLPEATRAGIPTIESEIGGLGKGNSLNRQKYRQGLMNLLIHMQMLDGELHQSDRQVVVRPCEMLAPEKGLLRYKVDLNTWVDQSTPLADLFDLHGNLISAIFSPVKALVATQRWWPFVEKDQVFSILFEEIPNYPGPQGT